MCQGSGPSTSNWGLSPSSLNSFQVHCLLGAADISMRTPPLRHLPILPDLLHHHCLLTPSLGPLGPSMQVCLTFMFFAMLRQSNLAPTAASTFDPSRHTYRGDISFHPLVCCFSSARTRLTKWWASPRFCPYPWCLDTPQTQWQPSTSSFAPPQPLALITPCQLSSRMATWSSSS